MITYIHKLEDYNFTGDIKETIRVGNNLELYLANGEILIFVDYYNKPFLINGIDYSDNMNPLLGLLPLGLLGGGGSYSEPLLYNPDEIKSSVDSIAPKFISDTLTYGLGEEIDTQTLFSDENTFTVFSPNLPEKVKFTNGILISDTYEGDITLIATDDNGNSTEIIIYIERDLIKPTGKSTINQVLLTSWDTDTDTPIDNTDFNLNDYFELTDNSNILDYFNVHPFQSLTFDFKFIKGSELKSIFRYMDSNDSIDFATDSGYFINTTGNDIDFTGTATAYIGDITNPVYATELLFTIDNIILQ